ncbi:hypothetical protein PO909_028414 [Leuciscus waleckii]
MEGDSVTLNSSLTEIQTGEEIMWRFGTNGSLIAKTDGVKNTIPDDLDGRFRDRLKLDKKTGSLTIMNITTEDAGVYEVKISRSSSPSTYRFNVTVYATTSPDAHTHSRPLSPPPGPPSGPPSGPVSPTALISTAAAAAGFLVIVAAVGMIWICKKHRKADQEGKFETRDEEITYADPTFYKRNTQKSVRSFMTVICVIISRITLRCV